jgi:hypothetical protein
MVGCCFAMAGIGVYRNLERQLPGMIAGRGSSPPPAASA